MFRLELILRKRILLPLEYSQETCAQEKDYFLGFDFKNDLRLGCMKKGRWKTEQRGRYFMTFSPGRKWQY